MVCMRGKVAGDPFSTFSGLYTIMRQYMSTTLVTATPGPYPRMASYFKIWILLIDLAMLASYYLYVRRTPRTHVLLE